MINKLTDQDKIDQYDRLFLAAIKNAKTIKEQSILITQLSDGLAAITKTLEKAGDMMDLMKQTADNYRDTMAKMEYNHQYDREQMSRVVRILVQYADRVAERHPQAVTINGQNARIKGAFWLAKYDREKTAISLNQTIETKSLCHNDGIKSKPRSKT